MTVKLLVVTLITFGGIPLKHLCASDTISAEQEFSALRDEYQQRVREHDAELESVTEDAALERLSHLHPDNAMVHRFIECEGRHRGTLVGLSSLHHLVSLAFGGYGGNPDYNITNGGSQALGILTSHYGDHKDLDAFFFWLKAGNCSDEAKRLLRRATESPHRHVRGNATLKLSEIHAHEYQVPLWMSLNLELVGNTPDWIARATRFREVKDQFSNVDARHARLSRQKALELCDEVIGNYSDVLETPRTTYGPVLLRLERGVTDQLTQMKRRTLLEVAEPQRYALRHLGVGQVSPDIAGPDAFGNDLTLSDHRGKVTVLMFSFKGCGPCEAMYPSNQKLVEKYRDRPFAFLGVMGDAERATVQETVRAGEITWPVWWDGGTRGPIHRRFNVTSWPEIYVMDALGVIRYRHLRDELLELGVDRLVKEAEE